MENNIVKLNALFRKEELRIKDCYLKLKQKAEEMLLQKLISDYETDLKFQLYTKNEFINKKYSAAEGDPFYETVCIFVEMFEDDEFFNMDWSENNFGFPICYTTHDVLYHSKLDWADLKFIDFIYYDLTFIYQFCLEEVSKTK